MSHSIINVALNYEDDVVAARQRARQIAGRSDSMLKTKPELPPPCQRLREMPFVMPRTARSSSWSRDRPLLKFC